MIIDRITEVIISEDAVSKLQTISQIKQQQHTASLAADQSSSSGEPTLKKT